MHKEILSHKRYITEKIPTASGPELKALLRYHNRRVRDFQHERLIHLLVTFFFGFLLLASIAALLFAPTSELQWLLAALTTILVVLETAYIRHYYQLENGVQSLYALTDQLSRL